jgi:hypothetical protein
MSKRKESPGLTTFIKYNTEHSQDREVLIL